MGIFQCKNSNTQKDDYKSLYRVRSKETAAMKKVWLIIENDISYYGSIFSTILLHNHPQYVKYFHEDSIPEFVQEARIKKKFSAVCAVVSALFIDYSKKHRQRDHLLGYIAMIHKDMQLAAEDLENFMMDLLEMLIQERPKEMTAECTLAHIRYFGGLLNRIGYFMKIQKEKNLYELEAESPENNCSCFAICDNPSIYGRSIDYWITKEHYWQVRMAVWSSLEKELSGMSSFLSTQRIANKAHHPDAIKHVFGKRPNCPVDKDRRDSLSKLNEHFPSGNTSFETKFNDSRTAEGDSLHKRTIAWYEKCKSKRQRYGRNSRSLNSSQRMESIPEVRSRQKIDLSFKASVTNAQTIPVVGKDFETTKIHAEHEKSPGRIPTKRKTMIDIARARKRHRDKKGRIAYKKRNEVHPTNETNNVEDYILHS